MLNFFHICKGEPEGRDVRKTDTEDYIEYLTTDRKESSRDLQEVKDVLRDAPGWILKPFITEFRLGSRDSEKPSRDVHKFLASLGRRESRVGEDW